MEDTSLDLVVAGTDDAVLMVESEADELSEEVMLGAVMFGHREFQPIIEACIRMGEKAAKEPRNVPESDDSELKAGVAKIAQDGLVAAYGEADKQTRQTAIAALRDQVNSDLVAEDASPDERNAVGGAFKSLESDIVRGGILDTEKRIDGRGLADVRMKYCSPIWSMPSLALWTRQGWRPWARFCMTRWIITQHRCKRLKRPMRREPICWFSITTRRCRKTALWTACSCAASVMCAIPVYWQHETARASLCRSIARR